jgi:hypothetical protein
MHGIYLARCVVADSHDADNLPCGIDHAIYRPADHPFAASGSHRRFEAMDRLAV